MPSDSAPFFSILVPCYNVAPFLDEMMASVRGQSFKDFELILSCETSTDQTLEMCREAAKADARVHVISGVRSGSPSTPRNRALGCARGRYIVFLDGDDRLADDALQSLHEAIVAHGGVIDLVQGATTEFREDAAGLRTFVARHFNYEAEDVGKVKTGLEALTQFAEMPRFAMPMVSLTVARRDYLLEHGLTFVDGLKYEDNEWTPRAMTFAKAILVVGFDIYRYRRREGSITMGDSLQEIYRQKSEMIRSLFLFFGSHDLSEPLARVWARTYVSFFFDQIFLYGATDAKTPIPARDFTRCLRRILEKGGRRAFLKLALYAGFPKKAAALLVILCGITPLLDLPAKFYVQKIYHPLVMRRFRKRGR